MPGNFQESGSPVFKPLLTSPFFSKAFNYCENFAQSVPNIGSAVTLAKLLVTIATQTEDPALETKIGKRKVAIETYRFVFSVAFQSYHIMYGFDKQFEL